MKTLFGIKFGGLQQKILNMMLLMIIALIAVYTIVSVYQQRRLAGIVQEAGAKQQAAIETASQETMQTVLESSMSRTTALQAYIADDLFSDVLTDVSTLQAFATELFKHADNYPDHPYFEPDPANAGIASVQMQHEKGVDPSESETLGLVANMSEMMLAVYENSERLDSCYVATADGCILFVNNRSDSYFTDTGEVYTLDVRHRPWYTQASSAGELIFTDVVPDAFTGILTVTCAAPVYDDGELVAVVGADIFLDSISDYVRDTSSANGFLCVVNDEGKVLFSPQTEGTFKPETSEKAADLRESENEALASFISQALTERTALTLIDVDGKPCYLTGAPMQTLGWTVISVVEKDVTEQPTTQMLAQYDEINQEAQNAYQQGANQSAKTFLVLTGFIVLLALTGALVLAGRIVKPLETMTKHISRLSGTGQVFEMEKAYQTGDEIEVLAETFADVSAKTKEYVAQINRITAEKERISAELSLATRIQYAMLPHIFPPFPEKNEIDIYASMDPAKEVGGDFYDFFLIDDDHLAMVMADVSGKGVPAALFMMASKIILQSVAMLGGSPAEILTKTNQAICSNNQEEMFVTVWVGILEISTGKLTAANAGHEYPVIQRGSDGRFEIIKDKHGLVIGAMDGVSYREYELRLEPGSKLFLYTDGVPEATNAENELYGLERMLDALNTDRQADPQRVLHNVRASVDAFVKDATQFDDITMLCMEYKGKEAETPADLKGETQDDRS